MRNNLARYLQQTYAILHQHHIQWMSAHTTIYLYIRNAHTLYISEFVVYHLLRLKLSIIDNSVSLCRRF